VLSERVPWVRVLILADVRARALIGAHRANHILHLFLEFRVTLFLAFEIGSQLFPDL
jgi:hypothetical protein